MFEFGKLFGSVSGKTKDTRKSGNTPGLLEDPIKISLILAVVIIVIIYFVFKDAIDEDHNFFNLMFRAGLFTIIPVVSLIFLHNKNLEGMYKSKYSDKGAEDIAARSREPNPDDVDVSDVKSTVGKPEGEVVGKAEDDADKSDKHIKSEKSEKSGGVTVNIAVAGPQPLKSGAFKPPK